MEKSEKRRKKAALFRRKSAAGSILVALQDMEILKPLAPQGFPDFFGSHLVANDQFVQKQVYVFVQQANGF